MSYEKLSSRQEYLASQIVDCAYRVHSSMGPGLLESIYETCFCYELAREKITFQRQVSVPIEYDCLKFESGFRIDVFVENTIICELKAVEHMIPLYDAQLLTYLKLTRTRLGFLINFHVPLIKDGIRRKIL